MITIVIMRYLIYISLFVSQVCFAQQISKNFTDAELKKKLTSIQYKVTQHEGTERPFKNEYWNNKKPGIYVDIVKGEPLFSSLHKFKSGTGWPSFTKPLVKKHMVYKEDNTLFSKRTEVRSKISHSHLGHVFDDGPAPTGKRYCINSASLKFIPVKDLKKLGYGEFLKDFTAASKKAELKKKNIKKAYFAGGCFWCMEPPFEKQAGVLKVDSGFSGGDKVSPSYKQVSSGSTSHIEAVVVVYDSSKVSYDTLLDIFWRQINPTQGDGQFVDKGPHYRSAIFYQNDEEKKKAKESLVRLKKLNKFGGKKIVTDFLSFKSFYKAEEYHQDYYKKNPIRYKFYRNGSGRDKYLKKIWGK